ncbi:B12-binding domain-containing radical SAM protein [Candidatus Pacearchaeota archaeon]|nr:B12-binding domain-containing radical SAM protein [Candidatus Pacearchaeota archaeon]
MKVHFYYLNINSGLAYGNGVGILSAVLKQNNHTVTATSLISDENLQEIIKNDIKKHNPDIFALSIVTNQAKFVPTITKTIKENSKGIIIAGGIHATIAPEDLIKKGIDYVFQGEAENTLLEFINKLEKNESVNEILGIYPNKLAPLPDLSKIPQEDKEILKFGEIIKKKNMWAGEIIATRGCPYECSYCCNSTLNDMYRKNLNLSTKEILRKRPADHVIEEIKSMQESYPEIKMFILGDDTFTLDKTYCLELLKKYKENIHIPFVCNVNLLAFDRDIAKALKQAGCFEIKIGIESGSERLRKEILRRYITNEKILSQTKIAHEEGLSISTFNMIGLPTETKEELLDTLNLNAKIKADRMKIMIFYPYPLTPACEICDKNNLINYDTLENLDNYNTNTPLKFNEDYMKLFSEIWNNPSEKLNKILGYEFYGMMPNFPGMVIKKERLKNL